MTKPTKSDAEAAIRHLCHVWETEKGVVFGPDDDPSFAEFESWLGKKGYSHYLDVRSACGDSAEG